MGLNAWDSCQPATMASLRFLNTCIWGALQGWLDSGQHLSLQSVSPSRVWPCRDDLIEDIRQNSDEVRQQREASEQARRMAQMTLAGHQQQVGVVGCLHGAHALPGTVMSLLLCVSPLLVWGLVYCFVCLVGLRKCIEGGWQDSSGSRGS